MSFDNKGFSPVHVNAGPLSPRIFSYFNPKDLLSEILKPGYFNEKKILLRPNTFIKVICSDAIVELVVDTNIGDLTMKDEFLRATDPYIELKKHGHPRPKPRKPRKPRRTEAQMVADKKKKVELLAKTG